MDRSIVVAALVVAAVSAGAGCTAQTTDVEAVDTTEGDLSARAPANLAALVAKNWVATGAVASDGDVRQLRLYADGTYVRLRCYGPSCGAAVAETDRYTAFRSSGKTYVEFWSFERVLVPGPPPKIKGGAPSPPEHIDHPVVADVYEIKATGSSIKLRKTFSSRWVTLHVTSDEALCTVSGGTWSPPAGTPASTTPKVPPTAKGQQPATPPPAVAAPVAPTPAPVDAWNSCHCAPDEGYVAGGGGCTHIASAAEDACDSTNGSYADDDPTKLGTYCACGVGRTLDDTGCTAILP
jgi:hypothetical protein